MYQNQSDQIKQDRMPGIAHNATVYIGYTIALLLVIASITRVVMYQPKDWEEKESVHREGTVIDFPYTRETTQIIKVKSTNKSDNDKKPITIYTARYPQYHIKDTIDINGTMAKNNAMYRPEISIKANTASGLESTLFAIKNSLQRNIERSMTEPYAAIAEGMLLGVNANVPTEITEMMQRAGTMHMLVVSGFNITIVTAFVLKAAGFIKRRSALILAALAVIAFIMITGAQPPILRAGIMGLLALSADGWGRPVQGKRLFTLTIMSMLILWPELFYSLSFQLSALATAGILFIVPILSQITIQYKLNKYVQYIVTEGTTTISAQCAVVPLLLNSFGNLSIISPLINLATAWTVPYIMIGAIITGMMGYLNKTGADLFGAATTAITYIFVLIQQLGTSLPYTYYENIQINPAIIGGIYVLIVALTIKYSDKNKCSIMK